MSLQTTLWWTFGRKNEIPFVQSAFPNEKIVVILVGTHEFDVFQEVADGLYDVSKKKKYMLLLIVICYIMKAIL